MRTLRHAVERGKVHHAYLFVGSAWHGQDVDGEDPRRMPELRARPDDRAVRRVRVVRVDRECELARRDRDGCGVEQLGRRHPRAARERRLRARERAPQGVHPRRGPHALDGRLERVPEDARGAAAEHRVRARDDRGAEGPGDGRRPLPPLRLPPPQRRADRERRAAHRRGRVDRDPAGRGRRAGALGDRAASATRWARSSSSSPTAATRSRWTTCSRCWAWPMRVCSKRPSTRSPRATRGGRCKRSRSASSRDATPPRSPRTWRCARELLVVQTLGEVPAELSLTPEADAALQAQAERVAQGTVVRLLELLGEAMEGVRAGADPRTRLELSLVKAARPDYDASTRALQARIARLEAERGAASAIAAPPGGSRRSRASSLRRLAPPPTGDRRPSAVADAPAADIAAASTSRARGRRIVGRPGVAALAVAGRGRPRARGERPAGRADRGGSAGGRRG